MLSISTSRTTNLSSCYIFEGFPELCNYDLSSNRINCKMNRQFNDKNYFLESVNPLKIHMTNQLLRFLGVFLRARRIPQFLPYRAPDLIALL